MTSFDTTRDTMHVRCTQSQHTTQAVPIQLLLQRRQSFSSFLPWLKIENLMQQWILLQVRLKPFCQETPHGIQLGRSNQSIHYKRIAMTELDLGRSNSTVLLQGTLKYILFTFYTCFARALLTLWSRFGHALPSWLGFVTLCCTGFELMVQLMVVRLVD